MNCGEHARRRAGHLRLPRPGVVPSNGGRAEHPFQPSGHPAFPFVVNTAKVDKAGVRAVAVLEAAKGLLVLLTGFALFSGLNKDFEQSAERLVTLLHLNPAHELPRIFIETAQHLNDMHLQWLAWLAMLYSVVRFTEAYGLWNQRKWAEWFAIISCSVYIPIELYELTKPGFYWTKIWALLINLIIVLYLLLVLRHQKRNANRS